LTKVGVTGVKKPVTVSRGERCIVIHSKIDVFVDLPSTQKGSHLSRNLEIISELVDRSVREPVKGLEVLAANICRSLLEKHEYASWAEVNITGDYFLERKTPQGKKSLESFKLMAMARNRRGDSLIKKIGVEAIGMTACPCAMETVRSRHEELIPAGGSSAPVITHNQRNVSSIIMEVPEANDVEADDLVDIIEASFSSPTYEILKRGAEADVVVRAHNNPKFVEDVVREMLGRILERYSHLPDKVLVTARSESEESIHKHNAFAERHTTLGDLRK
jgi:GTP cyclohydrolase-4